MSDTLNQLQQRLAVASEKNRANNERRAAELKAASEKFGCGTVEELEAYVDRKCAEAAELRASCETLRMRAEVAVAALEAAVSGRQS